MITLIRWILLKQKEIKLKLAFYSFVDQNIKKLANNPEKLEKKITHAFAEIIHSANQTQKSE